MFCKICGTFPNLLTKSEQFLTIIRRCKTHYDVLNLPRNCTAKEIKSAFIKLSKENHPDVNRSEQSHAKFQKINEAYNVLGKFESRRNYDLGLACEENFINRKNNAGYYEQATGRNPFHDPHFWANRDKSKDKYYEQQPYYGIDGIPKLPNSTIMFFCILLTFVGVGIQFIAISHSLTFKRDNLIKRSIEAEELLKSARELASTNGNAAQLEALKARLRNMENKSDKK